MTGIEVTAAALALALVVGFFVVRVERSNSGGLYFWQRRWLCAHGAVASGSVLEQTTTGTASVGTMLLRKLELVIELRAQGLVPWRVPLRYELAPSEADLVRSGCALPMRFDPRRPSRVVIDWPALRGEPRSKAR